MFISLKFVIFGLSLLRGAVAIGIAIGYGSKATGGGSATAQVPNGNQQLVDWLADSTARVIQLNGIYDFTSFYGTTQTEVCDTWTCSPNPQSLITTLTTCSKATRTVTLNKAGFSTNLQVGSNKTLLGKGSNAGIKGIGLVMKNGVSNIIIQNIKITDLNSQYVWGGDGILISGASNIWVDHCYFNRAGRQFITTGFGAASGVTISNNYFDGTATWSTGCDGHHYWNLIFAGNGDKVTFARNWLYYGAGRSPHSGGQASTDTMIYHFVNNYISSNTGHAMDIGQGTYMLAEGNYFDNVRSPVGVGTTNAHLYFPTTVNDAYACSNAGWSRVCEWNRLVNSDAIGTYLDTAPFNTAMKGDAVVSTLVPMPVADVPAFVKANAGVGKVN